MEVDPEGSEEGYWKILKAYCYIHKGTKYFVIRNIKLGSAEEETIYMRGQRSLFIFSSSVPNFYLFYLSQTTPHLTYIFIIAFFARMWSFDQPEFLKITLVLFICRLPKCRLFYWLYVLCINMHALEHPRSMHSRFMQGERRIKQALVTFSFTATEI